MLDLPRKPEISTGHHSQAIHTAGHGHSWRVWRTTRDTQGLWAGRMKMNPLFASIQKTNAAYLESAGLPNPYGFTDEELNGTPVNAAEIETSRRIAEGVPAEAAGKLPWLCMTAGRIYTIPLEFCSLELECGYHATVDGYADLVYVAISGHDIYPYLTREQRAELQAECQHELDVNEIEVAV